MDKLYLHLDMDAFFSSIEQLSNPNLAGKPVIVCGSPDSRSVVSTASYEARKYGLKSGMPIGQARKLCPDGIYVTGNPRKYVYTSVKILGILRDFTSQVEPFSVDEAFLEFGGIGIEKAIEIAGRIKKKIKDALGLTCSIGIGRNKITAKMASDIEKPDGLTVIEPDEFLAFFGDREVGSLWGVGDKTAYKINNIGIKTVRELALFSEAILRKMFGEYGSYLKRTANGIDDSPLIPYFQGVDPKSIGHEHTFSKDVSNRAYLLSCLLRLSEQVGRRMRKDGYVADTVTVKIRFDDFKTITRQRKVDKYFDNDRHLFETARALLLSNYREMKLRLLGVSVSGLEKRSSVMIDPIFPEDIKGEDCVRVVDSIRDRFGEDSIARGASILRH
jgi:DNA polymerase-4